MLLQRYALVQQRMLRQDHFLRSTVQVEGSDYSTRITPIEGLLGRKGVKILLGIILQVGQMIRPIGQHLIKTKYVFIILGRGREILP